MQNNQSSQKKTTHLYVVLILGKSVTDWLLFVMGIFLNSDCDNIK